MKPSIKALALIGLGLLFFSRIYFGTLYFYISPRFAWLVGLAAILFIVVGASYRNVLSQPHEHEHDHPHDHAEHQHGRLSWGGLLLVILPVLLGFLVPPKPLGAAALSNREINVKSLTSVAPPGVSSIARQGEKNIYDWLVEFQQTQNPAAFADKEAKVTGFVFRDGRFGNDSFMVSRFVINCCAADAAPLGLIVRWPKAAALTIDQWVEVSGRFQTVEFNGEQTPLLVADKVTPVERPNQPYIFPY